MDILIIDDSKLMLKTLEFQLKELGHTVHVADSAELGIIMAKKGKYDLLISDLIMPGVSGLSLVNTLRSVHHCNTPIIIMSAEKNKTLLDDGFETGVADFLFKPFSTKELEEKINKVAAKVQ
jgi:two-component system response regulator CiaR